MKNKSSLRISLLLLLAVGTIVPLLFNNCAGHEAGSSNLSSLAAASPCDPALKTAFSSYHQVLKNKCAGCHITGGQGNGAFADYNADTAFSVFRTKGEALIYSFAINPNHRPPSSGTANVDLLTAPKATWTAAFTEYNACLIDQSNNGGNNGGNNPPPGGGVPGGNTGGSYVQPTIRTISKPLNLTANANPTALTFNLATELQDLTKAQAGATFTVQVQARDVGTAFYYVISAPVIRGATAGSLRVKNVGAFLNDAFVPAPAGTIFQAVDRFIPQAANRNLSPNGGGMIITVPALANNQIGFAFELFEQAVVDNQPYVFNPPTHTILRSNAGQNLITTRCAPCHTTQSQGNLNLTVYDTLLGRVIPFAPDASYLYQRINTNTMPPAPAAPLTAAEKEVFRQWILDGAPR